MYLIWIMFLMGHRVTNATAPINCTEILANMKITTNTMTDGTTESPANSTMVSVETNVTGASTESPVTSTMMTETTTAAADATQSTVTMMTNNSTMEEATTQSPDSGTTMDLIAYCLMTTTNTDTTTMMSDSSTMMSESPTKSTTTASKTTTTASTAELLVFLSLSGGGPFSDLSDGFIKYVTKFIREFLQTHCDSSSSTCCSSSQSAMVSLNFKGGVIVLRDTAVLYGFRFSFSLDCTASASRRAVNQVAPGAGFGIDLTAVKNLISQNLKKLNEDLTSCCVKKTAAECCEATVKSAEVGDSTQAIATVLPPIGKLDKLSNLILIAILSSIGCISIATLIVTMIGLSKRNKRINQRFMRPPMPGLMPGPCHPPLGPPAALLRPQPRPYGPMMPRIWPVNQPRPYQFPPMSKHWSNNPRRMF